MWQALFLSGNLGDPDRIQDLAKHCDRIWTADGGLDRARMLDFQPDMHVGDNDSLSPQGLAYLRDQDIPRIKFPEKKDEPDSALALHYMLEAEYAWRRGDLLSRQPSPQAGSYPSSKSLLNFAGSGLIFLAGLGSRVDHVLANLDLASRYVQPDLAFLMTDGLTEVWTFKGPCQAEIHVPGENQQDTYISLLAVSPEVKGLSLQGSLWPLDQRKLFQGINLGISNQPASGQPLRLQLDQGTLRMVLSREDKDQAKLQL
ncbi:MAG: thiamine pyrophosphokinase [Eubacteriales bacterium]|nr:thiamine pyrophosphokinase [Clostridiales bacterium]MDY5836930.1 thiamine pyrophosphokinase [Eubacteriales bacterium]